MKYILVIEYQYTSPLIFAYENYNFAMSMYEAHLGNHRVTLFENDNGKFKELMTQEEK